MIQVLFGSVLPLPHKLLKELGSAWLQDGHSRALQPCQAPTSDAGGVWGNTPTALVSLPVAGGPPLGTKRAPGQGRRMLRAMMLHTLPCEGLGRQPTFEGS